MTREDPQKPEPRGLDAWDVTRIVLFLLGAFATLGTFGLTLLLVVLEILQIGQ